MYKSKLAFLWLVVFGNKCELQFRLHIDKLGFQKSWHLLTKAFLPCAWVCIVETKKNDNVCNTYLEFLPCWPDVPKENFFSIFRNTLSIQQKPLAYKWIQYMKYHIRYLNCRYEDMINRCTQLNTQLWHLWN